MKTDIEIARSIELHKINEIAGQLGIPEDEIRNYGPYIAKIPEKLIDKEKLQRSRLILVTSISSTKAGIG